MANVPVKGFDNFKAASRSLAEAEYREFLLDIGVPPDLIDEEVRKFLEQRDAFTPS